METRGKAFLQWPVIIPVQKLRAAFHLCSITTPDRASYSYHYKPLVPTHPLTLAEPVMRLRADGKWSGQEPLISSAVHRMEGDLAQEGNAVPYVVVK